MNYLQWLVAIGGALGAVVAIWRTIVFFVHLSDDIKDMKRHVYENHLACLRLTVMSSDMPLGERIVAGASYIKEGGNGEVKKYIETELHAKEILHE